MTTPRDQLVAQIDAALKYYLNLSWNEQSSKPVSTSISTEAGAFCSAAVSAIENATGRESSRSAQARSYAKTFDAMSGHAHPLAIPQMSQLKGILGEVRSALMAGYLVSYGEMIRSDVFGDVLEMARHLLDEGYKDPAAVIAGTALEVHLRDLCRKHNTPVTEQRGSNVVPRKAFTMNDDLKTQGAYSGIEHAQVQAWQRLRNEAAHGNYSAYDEPQVALMVQGVRDFIGKHPA